MDSMLKQFSGHSGCSVYLMKSKQECYVRKISPNIDYNIRLKKQAVKQYSFKKYISSKVIHSPKILNEGYTHGLYYFDMEYVNGINLCNAMHYLPVVDIEYMLTLFFNEMKTKSYNCTNDNACCIFKNKVDDLRGKLDFSSKSIANALDLVTDFDFSHVQKSLCCGDLTLENILITRENNIYLIDFLDSFYNSWMIDVAKLLQDIEIGWAYRAIGCNTNLKIRLLIARRILLNMLRDVNIPHADLTVYHIVLLNLLRILPYCNDKNTFTFVEQSLSYVAERLKKFLEKET